MTDIKKNTTNTEQYISNSHGAHAAPQLPSTDKVWTHAELKAAHQFCIINQESVKNSALCGCFHCLKMYSPDTLTDADLITEANGLKSYVCPHCGIDSVLGDQCEYPITLAFLTAMKVHFFYPD
jgi:hypothetical protein